MASLEAGVAALGAVAVAAIGAALTYFFDKRKAAWERTVADKIEHYKNLILCLKNLREGGSQHIDLLWFEYSFLWLHAPDSVIRAFNSLVITLNAGTANRESLAPLIGELLLQVRRDIGFGDTTLQSTEFHGRLD